MSIQNEIKRIASNISAAYDVVQEKGGNLPKERNSDNLATAIAGIPAGSDTPSDGGNITLGSLYNWQEVKLPTAYPGISSAYYDIMAYGGGRYVVFSSNPFVGTAIYSDDAKEWKTTQLPFPSTSTTKRIYDVKYIDDKFIAVGGVEGLVFFSKDGEVWEQPSSVPSRSTTYYNVAGGDGKIVILSGSATVGLISLDGGDTWEVNSSSQASNSSGYYLAYGNGTFVYRSSGDTSNVYYSTDGKKWTKRAVNCSQFVDFINGQFFAVNGGANSGFTVATSEDGTSWQKNENEWLQTISSGATKSISECIQSAAYGNGMYIMVLSKTMATSAAQASPILLNIRNDNLSNWIALPVIPRYVYKKIVFDGKRFTAISNDGVVAYLEI